MNKESRETSIYYHKTNPNMFQEGNLITCPSDLTGALWRVIKKREDNSLDIVLASHKTRPKSEDYPRKMNVIPKAFHGWKKVSGNNTYFKSK